MTVPPSCQSSVGLYNLLCVVASPGLSAACCQSLAGSLRHQCSLTSLLKHNSDITCLILICNANMCAKKKQRMDGWPKFLGVWRLYLWTSWSFLPLRKRTLPNAPWVFCAFFFIDWKLLLSTTLWSSFSVREIPRKAAMFSTPRTGFWKKECNITHDIWSNYSAFWGVGASLHLSAGYIYRIFIEFSRTGVVHSGSLLHNYFRGDMSCLPIDHKRLYVIYSWAKFTLWNM